LLFGAHNAWRKNAKTDGGDCGECSTTGKARTSLTNR
jgi:hypothetical protein